MRSGDIANYPLLGIGVSLIPLSLAIYGTVTGTAVFRSFRTERTKDPFGYWFVIISEYGFFIWIFLLSLGV